MSKRENWLRTFTKAELIKLVIKLENDYEVKIEQLSKNFFAQLQEQSVSHGKVAESWHKKHEELRKEFCEAVDIATGLRKSNFQLKSELENAKNTIADQQAMLLRLDGALCAFETAISLATGHDVSGRKASDKSNQDIKAAKITSSWTKYQP